MTPGYHDLVGAICLTAGFAPQLEERATGNSVAGYVANGPGVALLKESATRQLPAGVVLREPAPLPQLLVTEAVWMGPDLAPSAQRCWTLLRGSGWGWLGGDHPPEHAQ